MRNSLTTWFIGLAAGGIYAVIAITPGAGQQPVSVTPGTPAIPNAVAGERTMLELDKLRAEITKYQTDANMGYIIPVVNLLSLVGLAFGLYYQRQTAIKLQQETQTASLNLQKRQETTNLELKITELVMDSPTNWHAATKFNVLRQMYADRLSEGFPREFKPETFPGSRAHELRLELFDALASQPSQDRDKVLDAFRRLFPDERSWWLDKAYPDPGPPEEGR